MSDPFVQGRVHIPPIGREREASYQKRISAYLHQLLVVYSGTASELRNIEGNLYASAEKEEALFKRHHATHGWNVRLRRNRHNPEILDLDGVVTNEAFLPQEWRPDKKDTAPIDQRPDYIHWSREYDEPDGNKGTRIISLHLTKYFKFQFHKEDDPWSGTIFSNICPEDPTNPESLYNKIGRITRAMAQMLRKRQVICDAELLANGEPQDLPEPRLPK